MRNFESCSVQHACTCLHMHSSMHAPQPGEFMHSPGCILDFVTPPSAPYTYLPRHLTSLVRNELSQAPCVCCMSMAVMACKVDGCLEQGKGLEKGSKVWGVGRASSEGILVHGNNRPLGLSAFEALAGSSAHRPAQFTFTSSGLSLQVLHIFIYV